MKNSYVYSGALRNDQAGDGVKESELSPETAVKGKLIDETRQRSQKRFRYAFLTSPDTVAIIRSKDNMYTDVNEMFSIFTGYDKDEIIGKTF